MHNCIISFIFFREISHNSSNVPMLQVQRMWSLIILDKALPSFLLALPECYDNGNSKLKSWTSLVAQQLRIHLICRNMGSIHDPGRSHMLFGTTILCNWRPTRPRAHTPQQRNHHNKKPTHPNQRKPTHSNENRYRQKIKTKFKKILKLQRGKC